MYVYVISAGSDRHKIGISEHPESRLATLQVGSAETLRLSYKQEADNAPGAEKRAHSELWSFHIRGEWFGCSEGQAISMVRLAIDGEPDDDEFWYYGGWTHTIGDVVECRKPALWLVGDGPSVGQNYTITHVNEAGGVDVRECPNADFWFDASMFWPAFGRLLCAA